MSENAQKVKLSSVKLQQSVPTEAEETELLFQWAALSRGKYPELAMMYHIPNEGKRSPATAAKLKAQGMQPGVPDICLPVSRGGFHALYIEMKRKKGGRASKEQYEWIGKLNDAGNLAVICEGFEQAKAWIVLYLENGVMRRSQL